MSWVQSQLGFSVLLMGAVLAVMLTTIAYCIYFERKISAWIQDRIGPNRVGPRGLLQPVADGLKFILKEDIIPARADRPLFVLAPGIVLVVALIGFAVIPWGGRIVFSGGRGVVVQVASLDIGLLYILAVGSMAVYGVVAGGWSSNNKYSFYGGMRAAAQMLSYEIPLGLAILVVVLTTGQVRLERIAAMQMDGQAGGVWNVLLHPLAFLVMLIAVLAEANRAPFDLPEAEQELVTGYLTEYSAMKMGMFYLAEYGHLITSGAFLSVLFLGGWEPFPFSWALGWGWIEWINAATTWPAALVRFAILYGKIAFFIFLFMWVRWTLPRFRFDQLMRLAWLGLVPIGMGLLAVTGLLVYLGRPVSGWAPLGDAAVLAAALVWTACRPAELSGRQPDLPAVPDSQGVVR